MPRLSLTIRRYTLSWKRSLQDVDLDGVEYKCLPSGLHGVKEDLVYFVHGTYAGVSAFVQEESDAQHRNANFVAVGALVPLSYGRLGRSWLHAAQLRQLARDVVSNAQDTGSLELFWRKHKQDEATRTEAASPSAVKRMSLPPGLERKRKRASSDSSTRFSNQQGVSFDHPALSVAALLDAFGPLLFPLYRAALLRKRILLLGTPPVQPTCNFVYMLSILSSIPQPLAEVVQPDTESLLRIQTLFNVGIHDIPYLSEHKRKARWLACTTDDILGEKKDLYDLLVLLPNAPVTGETQKKWPELRTADGTILRATQRDLRRYRLLRSELDRFQTERRRYRDNPEDDDEEDEISPLMRASTAALLNEVKPSEPGEGDVVEPVSWAAMAYNGFMWWASAGEMEAWQNEEARTDRQLLDEIPDMDDLLHHIGSDNFQDEQQEGLHRASATATIVTAYFHRLTDQIIQPLADIVEEADDDTEEGIAESAISVSSDDIRAMGLDNWSTFDKEFVKGAMELYFGREAVIEQAGTRICGVKIC